MSTNTRDGEMRRLPVVNEMSTEAYQATWNEVMSSYPFAIPNYCRQTKGEVRPGAKKKKREEEKKEEEEAEEDADENTSLRRVPTMTGGGAASTASRPQQGRGRPAPGSYISVEVAAEMAHVTAMERSEAVIPQATK